MAAPFAASRSESLGFLDKASANAEFGADYRVAVLSNVVSYEENVRAVLSKVLLGEADAGIVYSSDITMEATDQVGKIDIPDALNTVAAYPIALIVDAPHSTLALTRTPGSSRKGWMSRVTKHSTTMA